MQDESTGSAVNEKGNGDEQRGTKRPVGELDEEQVLYMGNERFSGPELLFNPSDIGESSVESALFDVLHAKEPES